MLRETLFWQKKSLFSSELSHVIHLKTQEFKHRLTTLNLPMIGKLVTNPRYEPHDLILDRWSLQSFLIDQL